MPGPVPQQFSYINPWNKTVNWILLSPLFLNREVLPKVTQLVSGEICVQVAGLGTKSLTTTPCF